MHFLILFILDWWVDPSISSPPILLGIKIISMPSILQLHWLWPVISVMLISVLFLKKSTSNSSLQLLLLLCVIQVYIYLIIAYIFFTRFLGVQVFMPDYVFLYGMLLFFILKYVHFVCCAVYQVADVLNIKVFEINPVKQNWLISNIKFY